MTLQYGTEAEHRDVLERAKRDKLSYVWSGDLRSAFLRENLNYGQFLGLLETTYVESTQESGYQILWK